MLQHTLKILSAAEAVASAAGSIDQVLAELRQLSLDEFGLFIISLPDDDYPAMSAILPPMASAEIQKMWTGDHGEDLLRVTAAFARQTENNFVRHTGRRLQGSQIMDFGCGYGRITRMMYYYSNPDLIWGADAWDKSLDLTRQYRLPGNFVKTDSAPDTIPVGENKFDLIFAFSVFTHLAPHVTDKCLSTIRNYVKDDGLFIATIRPVEYWPWHDISRETDVSDQMLKDHNAKGIAYDPHTGPEGDTYGDTSISFDYMERFGWEMVGHDWSPIDPMQLSVILRPKQ